jgi:hypothetical protein
MISVSLTRRAQLSRMDTGERVCSSTAASRATSNSPSSPGRFSAEPWYTFARELNFSWQYQKPFRIRLMWSKNCSSACVHCSLSRRARPSFSYGTAFQTPRSSGRSTATTSPAACSM